MGNKSGQNSPDPNVAYASLPSGGFSEYLLAPPGANPRISSDSSHPSPNHVVSTKAAESTYGIMMHMSSSLGVNCTYCHNSQSFRAWNLSTQPRGSAWYGLRMVRSINAEYMTPLASTFPAHRKGPMGDTFKTNCATCHQGARKPMNGASMRADNPLLWSAVAATPPAAPAPAVAAPAPIALSTQAGKQIAAR